MKPFFSILTTCYNCASWLKTTIKSVLKQDYKNWEMLILDDQSTDTSRKIIQQFSREDKRIKLILRGKRLRCGGAYNELTKEANGEICGVLDADDALEPKAIRKVIKVYERTGADFLWTQFWLCDHKLRKLKKGFSRAPKEGKSLLEVRHAFSHWRTFKTEMREKCQVFKPGLKAAVDKWMGYALEEAGQGVFYNKTLY